MSLEGVCDQALGLRDARGEDLEGLRSGSGKSAGCLRVETIVADLGNASQTM